jgi:Rod binding domain-containing protein
MSAALTPLVAPAAAGADVALIRAKLALADPARTRTAAQEFEAVFLNTMFQQMFTAIDEEGPFGGGPALGVWRSLLTDEYARTFAKAGGIGIADHVQRSLIALQEAQAR